MKILPLFQLIISAMNVTWMRNDMKSVDARYAIALTNADRTTSMTPFNYFKLFLNDDIFNNMVEQTNLHSVQNTTTSVNTSYVEI